MGLGSRAVFGRLRALLMTGGGHEEEEAGGLGDGSEGRFWVVFASCGWVSGEGSVAEIGGGSPSKRLSAIFPGPADLSTVAELFHKLPELDLDRMPSDLSDCK